MKGSVSCPKANSLEVRSLFHKHIENLLDGKQQLLDVLVGFHGFLALALQSAGIGFQSYGVQDNLQENCAIVLFTVMRPMMGAFPFLSIPLFFR